MVLAFGDYRLDIERRELRRGPECVELAPKAFDLLTFLVNHRDRVVTKDDLLQAVWGGRIVSESALTTRINAVRRAVGDDGATQRLVRTFSRKGIRFIGEVTEISDLAASVAGDVRRPAPPLPDKPSIAIMPFQNMSGDPDQDYFVDGIVEEIITALSRIRWLFVIASNSSFSYQRQSLDVKQVGRELGVRYLLKGSVRKAGNRVRITAQLIDAETGAHLWADGFDGSLEEMFELQDKVAISVSGIIEPALQVAEHHRSVKRPTQDLTAYDLYLRAARMATTTAEGERLKEAVALLEQAITRDPLYGPALGIAAVIRVQMDTAGATDDPARNQTEAIGLARRAVEVAPDDPAVLRCAGFALGYFGEDIGAAIALVDRSLALNPSNARAWRSSGILRIYAGDLDPAIEHLEKSIRLDPRANMSVPLGTIGIAHFFAGRFELALPKLLAATQQMPSYRTPYRFLTACYAHTGRFADAGKLLAKLRSMGIEDEPHVGHWRRSEHQELLLSGLRLAAGVTA